MVSPQLAQRLKTAGLEWRPSEGDSFAVPDLDQNGQVFILTPLATQIQTMSGYPFVAFHGSSEWAMDHVLTEDVMWLPSETQVRDELERRLEAAGDPSLRLHRLPERYHCFITVDATDMLFAAATASDAYGLALLYLLDGSTAEAY